MEEQDPTPITWTQSESGLVTLLLDAPGSKVNTITSAYIEALADSVTRLEHIQDEIPGVIVRSAKSSFLAGGDLNRLVGIEPAAFRAFVADLDHRKSYTRRLERLRCPVVAIINGPALGGGLELALSCHHSIAVDAGRTVVGLPEATLGLLPGAGGIVRVVDRLGIDQALDEIILTGRRFGPQEATEIGLIDEVVASIEEADEAALRWMASNRSNPARAHARPKSRRRPLPAASAAPVARAITAVSNVVVELDFETALHVESAGLGALVTSPATKNSIRINFFDTAAVRKKARSLAPEPAGAVRLEPAEEGRVDAVGAIAGHRTLTVSEAAIGDDHAQLPDARIVLEGVGREAWPLLWIVGDLVGDGQLVVEYSSDGSERSNAAVSALAKAGLLPIAVGARGPLSRMLGAARAEAIAALKTSGIDAERIAAALAWIGWAGESEAVAPGVGAGEPIAGTVELACDVLDAMAEAGVSALGPEKGETGNVTSVRAGGFPSWTGGVYAWRRCGRELARRIADHDVAALIEEGGSR